MSDLHDQILPFALQLADRARDIVRRNFRRRLDVEHKQDYSPVTAVDREIERMARDALAERFPGHGVSGEEFDDTVGDGVYLWVLDPIDGTKSFVTGKPLFGTLIALLQRSQPVLGVIDIPVLAERWLGARGMAVSYNGEPCATSAVRELAQATSYSATPDMFRGERAERFNALGRQLRFRCFGADCYAYGLLASGHTELVVEADMHPYDYMALVPVVEGAGGVISDWSGAPLGMASDGTVLAAANAVLHAQALRFLRG